MRAVSGHHVQTMSSSTPMLTNSSAEAASLNAGMAQRWVPLIRLRTKLDISGLHAVTELAIDALVSIDAARPSAEWGSLYGEP
jgi:hypothetical protein